MLFRFGPFEVDVDVEKTREYYANAPLLTDGCNCPGCRNYVKAVEKLPDTVQTFFSQFGVDLRKTPEVYVNCVASDGKLNYGGWYHICGKISSGESAWARTEDVETLTLKTNNHYCITERFAVTLDEKCQLLPQEFPFPAFQLEIITDSIPWVLEEENPYAELTV